ncbi:unnamed protein product, partial [Durusdinium trenchii]
FFRPEKCGLCLTMGGDGGQQLNYMQVELETSGAVEPDADAQRPGSNGDALKAFKRKLEEGSLKQIPKNKVGPKKIAGQTRASSSKVRPQSVKEPNMKQEPSGSSLHAPSENETQPAPIPKQAPQMEVGQSGQSHRADENLDGIVSLAMKARLPKRLGHCSYDAASRDWVPRGQANQVPKARRHLLLTGYTHQVEKSKTGAAACKRCGEKIAKTCLRVGYPVKDHRGEYGAIVNWFHSECARLDEMMVAYAKMGDAKLKKMVLGYDAMTKEERLQLREDLLSPAQMAPPDLPATQSVRQLPQHPAPKALKLPLLAFQAEGLGWMLEREADKSTRGGILADEMGMGKTLQTISLLLAGEVKGPTLVVCPAAAMLQWRNEILRFTEPGNLEVRLFYGTEKKDALSDLMDAKSIFLRRVVVLTTYQTLESDYRQQVNLTKVQCKWCGRLFQKAKLFYHQKYFCGPDAQRTEKQMKAQRKADYKDEAVKMMKIGGTATNITLNPLNAIRSAATSALRRRAKSTNRVSTPFPVSVLPDEAQEALRKGQDADSNISGDQHLSSAKEVATPLKRRSMGQGKPSSKCSPSPVTAPKRMKTTSTSAEPLEKPSSGWGRALKASSPSGVIELAPSEDGSDLELLQEEPCQNPLHESFKSEHPGASSKRAKTTKMEKMQESGQSSEKKAAEETAKASDEESSDEIDLSRSALYRTQWGRVVLDEAHRIKTRTNSTAQAAFALRVAGSRWCLSGTPLQNRVGEFWSIIRFLRFYPYAHYLCSKKGCGCVSLHYRFDPETSLCRKCGHTKMQHRSHFTKEVSNPIQKFGFCGAGKAAMEKLRTEVLDRILLRRTKVERAADVKLPALTVNIRKDMLSSQERDFYTAMYTQGRTQFDTYVESGTVLHNYAHVFDLIMRLRQAVDHPYLIIHGSLNSPDPAAGLIPTKSRGFTDICSLCQDDIEEKRAKATCGHAFHRDCLQEYLQQAPQLPSGGVGCPACFLPLTWAEEAEAEGDDDIVEEDTVAGDADKGPKIRGRGGRSSIMQKIKTSEFQSSTKIEALVQEIKKMESTDATSKALVFSQFTRFLELIEWRLKREGISAATVLGSMPIVSRNNIIVSFQTEPTLKVLLISLKAGGEGLNLQAADHIFLMDPWWNPAAEAQAIQRAHRIGQVRPVKALRLVAADTIEEKIIELQEKKQMVFDCTVGNSNQALQRLSAEDISFLFSN